MLCGNISAFGCPRAALTPRSANTTASQTSSASEQRELLFLLRHFFICRSRDLHFTLESSGSRSGLVCAYWSSLCTYRGFVTWQGRADAPPSSPRSIIVVLLDVFWYPPRFGIFERSPLKRRLLQNMLMAPSSAPLGPVVWV